MCDVLLYTQVDSVEPVLPGAAWASRPGALATQSHGQAKAKVCHVSAVIVQICI